MNSGKRLSDLEQLKHDMAAEWWKADEVDQFSLRNKLMRVGCRPLKRRLLGCQKSVGDEFDMR